MRWFRLYDEILDDPKMLEFTDKEKWCWISVLCLGNRATNRGSFTKNFPILCKVLHQEKRFLNTTFEKFKEHGMITNGNECYQIVNWDRRQFKSDNVTLRTQRSKERSGERLRERHQNRTEQNRVKPPPIIPPQGDRPRKGSGRKKDPKTEPHPMSNLPSCARCQTASKSLDLDERGICAYCRRDEG